MSQSSSSLSRLLKEPLFHFAVLGILIFAIYFSLNEAEPEENPRKIEVTQADIDRSAEGFQATWKRPPTDKELDGLVREMIREEIYVREALALGLDLGDSVIRRRLRQKMEFLTEASSETTDPQDTVLIEFYEANPENYSSPDRLAFEQIFLGEQAADSDAETVLAALQSGAAPETLGERSMLPPVMAMSTQRNVEGSFGRGVFEQVQAGPDNEWFGPVQSTFGQHVVRKIGTSPAALIPFEDIRRKVEQDWIAEFTENLKAERYQLLLEHYEVVMPGDVQESTE